MNGCLCVENVCVCVCESAEMWWCGGGGVGVQGKVILNSCFFCFINISLCLNGFQSKELRYVRHNWSSFIMSSHIRQTTSY